MALPQGLRFQSKAAFVAALAEWLESTDDDTIGGAHHFGQDRWIMLDTGDARFRLNANTKREAVRALVAHGDGAWSLRLPARAKATTQSRVVYLGDEPTPGLYLYLIPQSGMEAPLEV